MCTLVFNLNSKEIEFSNLQDDMQQFYLKKHLINIKIY